MLYGGERTHPGSRNVERSSVGILGGVSGGWEVSPSREDAACCVSLVHISYSIRLLLAANGAQIKRWWFGRGGS